VKHVTYAEKSLLMGDEAADLLMRYATLLGQRGSTDSVTVAALGADGNDVEAAFLLGPGAALMIETANTATPEPDNTDAVRYLADRIDELAQPNVVVPSEDGGSDAMDVPPGY